MRSYSLAFRCILVYIVCRPRVRALCAASVRRSSPVVCLYELRARSRPAAPRWARVPARARGPVRVRAKERRMRLGRNGRRQVSVGLARELQLRCSCLLMRRRVTPSATHPIHKSGCSQFSLCSQPSRVVSTRFLFVIVFDI